jgi:hypothetical protein
MSAPGSRHFAIRVDGDGKVTLQEGQYDGR